MLIILSFLEARLTSDDKDPSTDGIMNGPIMWIWNIDGTVCYTSTEIDGLYHLLISPLVSKLFEFVSGIYYIA